MSRIRPRAGASLRTQAVGLVASLGRWALRGVGALWVVATAGFALLRANLRSLDGPDVSHILHNHPGYPESAITPTSEYPASTAWELRSSLTFRPGDTVWEQYLDYLSAIAFRLDFGASAPAFGPPVKWSPILVLAGWTVAAVAGAVVVGYAVSAVIRTSLAATSDPLVDGVLRAGAWFIASVPVYGFAGLLYLVAVTWSGVVPLVPWAELPPRRWSVFEPLVRTPFALDGATVGAYLAVLGLVALPVLAWLPAWVESALTDRERDGGVRSPWVRGARLRGLRGPRVYAAHVARPTLLGESADVRATVATVAGGTVLISPVLAYPGLGHAVWWELLLGDYAAMAALALFLTAVVVVLAAVGERVASLLGLRVW